MKNCILAFTVVAALAGSADAGELQLAVGAAGAHSSWDGFAAFYTSTRFGYRFRDLVSVDFLGKIGYGDVDDRVLTEISLGGTIYGRLGRWRPYFRGAFAHQHEEPRISVDNDPFGAVFGVGDGIRHRAGVYGGTGVEVPFAGSGRWQWIAGAGVSVSYFPDPRGPSTYWTAGASVGFNYGL